MAAVLRRGRQDNLEAQQALLANGLKVVEPDSEAVRRMRTATAAANEEMAAQGVFSPVLLEQLLENVEEFRNGAGQMQSASALWVDDAE